MCEPGLTIEECEMNMLRQAVDDIMAMREEVKVLSDEEKHISKLVRDFLIDRGNMCFGGTAINELLPKKDKFYDEEKDMTDYDFFSITPIEDAVDLADICFKAGYHDVGVKPSSIHYGVFSIRVHNIKVADIVLIDEELLVNLQKEQNVIQGICYAPTQYLRQSLYLELSRPEGEIKRWEKIYPRLLLLNKYYPISCKQVEKTMPMDHDIYVIVNEILMEQNVVFMGGIADIIYIHFMDKQDMPHDTMPNFQVLCETPKETCDLIKKELKKHDFKHIDILHHPQIQLMIGEHYEIQVEGETIARIYLPVACHSYTSITLHKKVLRIATIETLLSYYLTFIYCNINYNKQRILCISRALIDIQSQYRLEKRGILKRFASTCIGIQQTYNSLKDKRTRVYEKLKNKKGSKEYNLWFFSYQPGSLEHQVKQKRKQIKKQTKTNKK